VVEHDEVSGCSGRDVVDGVYEGGAKIWECSTDLIEWLGSAEVPPGCTVLDLGCGAAMLGCWAASVGRAAHVICQDLNAPVLNELAAVNLLLNGGLGPAPGPAATLVAASWHGMAAELEAATRTAGAAPAGDAAATAHASPLVAALAGACDYVLASEVLYREEHYPDLLSIITRCLKPGTGVAIIGSKRNYFGATLGGSSLAFVQFVNARAAGAAGSSGAASPDCGVSSEGVASSAAAAASSAVAATASCTAAAPSPAPSVSAAELAVLRAEIVRSIEDGKSMTRDIITLRWAGAAVPPA
jgi:predicted nicotinamide N-methyase